MRKSSQTTIAAICGGVSGKLRVSRLLRPAYETSRITTDTWLLSTDFALNHLKKTIFLKQMKFSEVRVMVKFTFELFSFIIKETRGPQALAVTWVLSLDWHIRYVYDLSKHLFRKANIKVHAAADEALRWV